MFSSNIKHGLMVVAVLMLVMLTACSLGQTDIPTTNADTHPSNEAPPATNTTGASTTGETETTVATQPTQPTESTASMEPTVSTEATVSTEVTQPTFSTEPATPSNPVNLYTREELEQMDNTNHSYGPGDFLGRPKGALDNQKLYGQYGGNFIAPDDGNIYLTFDCGYEYYMDIDGEKVPVTGLILDVLKERNVKAVFFVTLSYAQRQPHLVQRIIDEGHTLGNHSTTHPVMTTISIDEMEYEVMTLHNYIKEHYDYTMTLFRPPTGAFSVRSLAVVQNLGYKTVNWSFAYRDWDTENQWEPSVAMEHILKYTHSGGLYLLHAVSYTNATILGDLIDNLRNMGYNLELFE